MRTSLGPKHRGRQSVARQNGNTEPFRGSPEEEEIDDFDEDEDEENEDGFHNQRMPEQHPAVRTTVQLMELMDGDRPYLDLNPHYQRDVVWTRNAKQMLIDSMFHGFFIPPVIFNVQKVVDETGASRYKRTCVDGKQRLTSIREFMRGRIPWKVGKKDWYYTTPTKEDGSQIPKAETKSILPAGQKELFAKKALLCVEYKDLTPQQEIELFQRVQLGKPLTKAEVFRASQGKWQDLARVFEREYAEVINLSRQNNRASGFWAVLQCFAQIVECQDPGGPNGVPRLRNRIPAIEQLCMVEEALDETTETHLRKVFDRFLEIARGYPSTFESKHYRRAKAFAPIEQTVVCAMISEWGDSRSNGMLHGDILLLRKMLRDSTEELRGNWACWKMSWDYIDELESYRGNIDGSTAEKRPSKNAKRSTRRQGIGNPLPLAKAANSKANSGAPIAPSMLPRSETPAEPDEDYRPSGLSRAAARGTNVAEHRKPPKAATSITAPVHNTLPFARRRPTEPPGDDSNSSSSSDDDTPMNGIAAGSNEPSNSTATLARKRTILDLGTGSNAAQDLEAKKAKLNATRIKQES